MKRIKEIIRLTRQGCTQREIASGAGVSKTTVANAHLRIKEQKIELSVVENLPEEQLLRLLYPEQPESENCPVEPDWEALVKELPKKGMNRKLLWLEYRESFPYGMGYSQFCHKLVKWKRDRQVTMAFDYEPGEVAFMDFSGLTVPYFCQSTDSVQQAQIFVSLLGYSSYTFVFACPSQSKKDWLLCQTKFFEFIQGVPKKLVPDNLKSAVTKPCRYDPELNPSYRELALHYQTCVLPARVRKPKDKSRVEKAVKDIQSALLARVRMLTFTSVVEINEALSGLLDDFNGRNFQRYDHSRKDLYEEEKQSLKSLPIVPFEHEEWKVARVNIDYHIEVDRHYYSVPYRFAREEVEVRYTNSVVEVFCKGARIASHKREHTRCRHTTLESHMPKNHQAVREWTPERIMKWAKSIGPSVPLICQSIVDSRDFPEQGFRSCLGLLRLAEKHTPEILEKACAYGLTIRASSYKTIKTIVESKSFEEQLTKKPTPQLNHTNIRGATYYF